MRLFKNLFPFKPCAIVAQGFSFSIFACYDAQMEHRIIDRHDPELTAALATAPVYRKHARVSARPALPGEEVVTILSDGKTETRNIAREGDWIVRNPSLEQYVVNGKKFLSRYVPTLVEGEYEAVGRCRAIENPFKVPISIMAAWGSLEFGDPDCMIADTCAPDGTQIEGEPYLIDRETFLAEMEEIKTAD